MIEGSYKVRHVNKLLQKVELFVKIENRQWKRAAARRRVPTNALRVGVACVDLGAVSVGAKQILGEYHRENPDQS